MAAPSLTQQQLVECEEQCDRVLCETLVRLARYKGVMHARKWREVSTRGPLAVYRRIYAHRNGVESVLLAGTGYIQGSLEDVERGVYCDTESDTVGIEAVLSGQRVRGSAVLQVMEKRGPETPFRFAGIKWRAIQDTSTSTGRAYDLLTFERMGVTLDSDNTEVAYHVVYSLPGHADWYPNISESDVRFPRLEPFALCYLYRKVSELQVLCFVQAEYWGTSRRDVAEEILVSRIIMASKTIECCNAKALMRMVDHCRNVPMVVSNTCQRCNRTRPSTGEALHLCGICRKSVCRACGEERTLCRISQSTLEAEKKTICVKCLMRVKRSASTSKISSHQAGKHREGRQRSHSHQADERKPVMRRMSMPEPAPAYNYDELLRKRASSGSWTSGTSSGKTSETDSTVPVPPRPLSPVALESARDRSRSNEDLYLPGLNQLSDAAQRQFQQHVERHRQLNAYNQRPLLLPLNTETPRTYSQAPPSDQERRREEIDAAASHSSVDTQLAKLSLGKKTAAQREFYQDLYTEL